METYRSGHNESDSKSDCGATCTRVRISPSPVLMSKLKSKDLSLFCASMVDRVEDSNVTVQKCKVILKIRMILVIDISSILCYDIHIVS